MRNSTVSPGRVSLPQPARPFPLHQSPALEYFSGFLSFASTLHAFTFQILMPYFTASQPYSNLQDLKTQLSRISSVLSRLFSISLATAYYSLWKSTVLPDRVSLPRTICSLFCAIPTSSFETYRFVYISTFLPFEIHLQCKNIRLEKITHLFSYLLPCKIPTSLSPL